MQRSRPKDGKDMRIGILTDRLAQLDELRAADLFCCAGGASDGLARAGFSVRGTDIEAQPEYPWAFSQRDALTDDLSGSDLVEGREPEAGVYRKYLVKRLRDRDGKHRRCEFFVLDLDHDEFAAAALMAYARACQEKFPELASDLRKRLIRVNEDTVIVTPAAFRERIPR